MKKRVNTVDHSTARVLGKYAMELIEALLDWQKYTVRDDPDNPGFLTPVQFIPSGKYNGDSDVIVAAICLRDKLNDVIKKSAAAQQ